MKNKTYNLKLNEDELKVLDGSLREYHSFVKEKHGEDASMMDEFKFVQNRVKHMIVKINESDRRL